MNKFKKNIWMYGIIGLYSGFVIMMVSFSVLVSHHRVDLVVTDYYKEEINYQKQINKQINYRALANKPVITIDTMGKSVQIQFPAFHPDQDIQGRVCFYRPNDEREDDTFPLNINQAGIAEMNLEKFNHGQWKMRMDWKEGKTPYYLEKKFKLE